MSFLRGKSASFTVFTLPESLTVRALPEIVRLRAFDGIPADETEATGFCSWRSILDAPIDSGYLEGTTNLWLTGLRKDRKRAPTALVTAQVARALADWRQEHPTTPLLKPIQKEITAEVRRRLDLQAQPRPSHGAVLIDTDTRLLYVEGPASAVPWMLPFFDCQGALFGHSLLNSQFLLWLAWLNTQDQLKAPAGLSGSISFYVPKTEAQTISASFEGTTETKELLEHWVGEQRARINRLGLFWPVDIGDGLEYGLELTLQDGGLRVLGLKFPDAITKASGSLEGKLALRLQVITAFTQDLASAFTTWAKAMEGVYGVDTLPDEYKRLLGDDESKA